MIVLPAIDIRNGQCVRLRQGDFTQATVYDADPLQVALRWQEAGASWLHIVDLDGAIAGQPVNVDLIARIRKSVSLHIEFGGGLRSIAHIEQVLRPGVDRVVLGTVALTDRALLIEALERWKERIAVGLDARNGQVAIAGWQKTSEVQATNLARELSKLGVQRFIYTDIGRDGMLQGPNFNALQAMKQASTSSLIASGGIHSLDDLRELAAMGIEGAIVGKALYTGHIDLAEAIREIER